jgi:CheY-like chemotaxis protein
MLEDSKYGLSSHSRFASLASPSSPAPIAKMSDRKSEPAGQVADPSPLPVTRAPPSPPVDQGVTESGSAHRVLVVDDDVDAAESLALLLEMSGHEVRVACEGRTAIELATRFRPDAILLDIGLPLIDGFEVARQLRGVADLQEVLLVALSGFDQPADRRRARDVGFDQYLTKPIDPDFLRRMLSGPLGSHRGHTRA